MTDGTAAGTAGKRMDRRQTVSASRIPTEPRLTGMPCKRSPGEGGDHEDGDFTQRRDPFARPPKTHP